MGKLRENPRYNVISMRISDEERQDLENLVQRTHKSVSEIMREAMSSIAKQSEHQDYRSADYRGKRPSYERPDQRAFQSA